jgi:hypothetical protein
MTTLLLDGQPMAILDEGEWRSTNDALLQLLQSWQERDGVTGYDPWPERNLAATAAQRMGEGWTVQAGDPPDFDPAVVY